MARGHRRAVDEALQAARDLRAYQLELERRPVSLQESTAPGDTELPWVLPEGRASLLPSAPNKPATRSGQTEDTEAQVLANPDWIANTLTITGPALRLTALRHAARGRGVIPWTLVAPRLAEDLFIYLIEDEGEGRLRVPAARTLADRLAAALTQDDGVAGEGADVPFDLHALLPIPFEILQLGPTDPAAKAWLWQNWSTSWPLRRVVEPLDKRRSAEAASDTVWRLRFWSADWSPWAAIAALHTEWPDLRFVLVPDYGNDAAR